MTKALPVHEFVKITCQLVFMAATHPLKLDFDMIPIGFHILSVNPSGTIHKFNGVIHYSMAANNWEISNSYTLPTSLITQLSHLLHAAV